MPIAAKNKQVVCTILDVRGTHGSGKSWLLHQALKQYTNTPILTEDREHLGYRLHEINGIVVGKYATACGGCDGVGSAVEVVRRVKLFVEQAKVVLLEGILVAHTFQRYSDLAKDLEGQSCRYHFLFLDTPLEICIERVKSRRLAAGNSKPFNPRNVEHDYHAIWDRVRPKCLAAGHNVTVLPWQNAWETLQRILNAYNRP